MITEGGDADGQADFTGLHRRMCFDLGDGGRYPGSSEKAEDDRPDEWEGEQSGISVSGAAFQDPGNGIYLSGRLQVARGRKTVRAAKSQSRRDQIPGRTVDANGSGADEEDNPLSVFLTDELG